MGGAGKRDVAGQIASTVGTNLARRRQAQGLSQEEVADRAGLHRTEISLLELGKRTPRIDTVVRVMGALGVDAEQAFEGVTWVPFSEKPGGYVELESRPSP